MDNEHSFLFFDHGPIDDTSSIDKCEELYVWFQRDVTPEEKKRIEETCPPPVGYFHCFADRFAYFGSPGDAYEYAILECYGDEEARAMLAVDGGFDDAMGAIIEMMQDGTALENAVPRFVDAFAHWAQEIHGIVPIAFIKGPSGADPDDEWNQWSTERAGEALRNMMDYAASHPELLEHCDEDDEEPSEDGPNAAALARYFSWIFCAVLNVGEGPIEGASIVDFVYASDGITGPIERLDYGEHHIQHNSEIVLRFLENAPDRLARLAELAPYTQLAYLASYDALRAGDVTSLPDASARIAELLDALPPRRQPIVTSLIVMIANNLTHVTPAFDEPDRQHAALAARVMELAMKRDDAPEEAFVNGGTFFEWSGDAARALDVARRGHTRFPKSVRLANNLVSSATLLGDPKAIAEYTALASDIARSQPPDEELATNQSYALAQAGKIADAIELLLDHKRRGGEMSARIWGNLVALVNMSGKPARSLLDEIVPALLEAMEDDELALDTNVLAGASALLNTNGWAREAVVMLDRAHGEGVVDGPLWINYTYSALQTGDPATIRRLVESAEEALEDEDSASSGLHENVAALYAALREPAQAIAHLVRCRELGHEDFASLANSEELRSLWELREFRALFV